MHLTRIEIHNFKTIEKIDFSLSDVNVFIGGNNSGKTTVIQAIHFAFTLFQSLTNSNKWPAATKRSVSISPSELIYVPSENPYHLGSGGRLLESSEKAIRFVFYFGTGERVEVAIRKGRINNILVEPDNVAFAKNITNLSSPFSIYSPGLAGVARSEEHVSNGVLLRALARGDANAFLRNILYRLRSEDSWTSFESSLASIFPDARIEVEFDTSIDQFINVSVAEPNRVVPLDLAGTGLLQAVQILSYYYLFKPKLVILDEPDSHLHPNNQKLLCSLLLSLSLDEKIQVMMTTHSRHVLDAIRSEGKVFWLDAGAIKPTSPQDHIDVLRELGALDVEERIKNSTADFVVLTEDRLSDPIKNIFERSGYLPNQYLLYPYNGVKSVDLLRPLIDRIRDLSNSTIIVHRDRDYLEPDEVENWNQSIRGLGAEPFITAGRDIEDYFCEPRYIDECGRDVPGFVLNNFLEQLGDGEIEKATESFVNGRIEVERSSGNFGQLNIGALSTRANRNANLDVLNMLKGKQKLAKIRRIFQENLRHRFLITTEIAYDMEPKLVAIRNRG